MTRNSPSGGGKAKAGQKAARAPQPAKSYASQVETHKNKGQQPGGINAAARELGIDKNAAHRATKVAAITPEAKAAAKETGLDNNQAALLQVAKAPPEEQA